MTPARRLAAILAADVAEYSRLIAVDDADTPKTQVGLIPVVSCKYLHYPGSRG